ncbi:MULTISPECIES: cytochrome b/b6 domain-containing protein [Paracoccus]|jgi:cytochrome b|uniref:Cytochrome B561 n=1 Tax=Paracoccus denitrificans (strain Pd 1222) TaxID=318586 RepID=A1B770_PARDP|nr:MULTISPECIES: cytochrome b/b6 domain-containing protein [Paracoccus]ABL71364.1 cytochrome B561 [Paracoccus denitrificans PD1222]MBB4629535.1 cytochrome b [Paracoccus denitrificans]MCU7430934.1 cytochrome b/b6 domain-containing protein [Paracoccus denitrificans]UFS67356.1 cytochrome b/b6 domain-containing protein [Paracoccus denitrificans]UPV97709.1 cytochrome b/b6 domain-containing protein [Paracoccus denitrificans]
MIEAKRDGGISDVADTMRVVRVWDPVVRSFHWGLVAAFAVAWLAADEVQPLHEPAGYAVAALLVLRLIWGFVGSHHARFAQFMRGPAATLVYLGDMLRGRERRHLEHNPAGAAMIVALMVTLSGTALSGWLLEQSIEEARAVTFVGEHGSREVRGDKTLKEVHETLANLALVLVALHVGGVALTSWRHRENLPRAMVTGRKRPPGANDVT